MCASASRCRGRRSVAVRVWLSPAPRPAGPVARGELDPASAFQLLAAPSESSANTATLTSQAGHTGSISEAGAGATDIGEEPEGELGRLTDERQRMDERLQTLRDAHGERRKADDVTKQDARTSACPSGTESGVYFNLRADFRLHN